MHDLKASLAGLWALIAILIASFPMVAAVQPQPEPPRELSATLEGIQEVPPNASPAIGSATLTLDTAINQLCWNIVYSGLLATEVAAHFHGPAPPGVNAGVQIPLPVGSPKVGCATLTDTQEADVLAGLWYINIHTTLSPGGEIRGQVVLRPVTVSEFPLSTVAVIAASVGLLFGVARIRAKSYAPRLVR